MSKHKNSSEDVDQSSQRPVQLQQYYHCFSSFQPLVQSRRVNVNMVEGFGCPDEELYEELVLSPRPRGLGRQCVVQDDPMANRAGLSGATLFQ